MVDRLTTLPFLRKLSTALIIPWVLSSCSNEALNADVNGSSVSFKIPDRIRTSQAVDQSQVMATVSANNQEVELTRNGDSFNGTITVGSGTELSFVLQIIEQVGTQKIVLATLSNTQLITNDTTITLRANQYSYPDNDADGYNNLTEREAGADYANSNSTPLNIDGETTGVEPTLDPGVLQYSAENYSVSEADGALTIAVTRTGGSDGRVTVRYMLNNETALRGQDFQAASGELIWEDGDSSAKTFEAVLLPDDDFEGEQTFTAHLFSATGGSAIGNGFSRVTLTDSTPAPQRGTLQFTNNTLQVTEADSIAVVSIERVGGSDGLVTVDYNTVDGTATDTDDYIGITSPRTLAWADGDTTPKDITIQILNDAAIEPTESFQLSLSSVRGGAVLGTAETTVNIADSTVPMVVLNGTASIADGPYNVAEGAMINVPVERLGGSDGAVSVSYTLTPGTALASTDYTPVSGTINWADQDSSAKTITLSALADTTVEGPEKFTLTLSTAIGGIAIESPSTEITIVDTTTLNPGTIAFSDTAATVNEGDSTAVSISRTNGSDQAVSVIVNATPTGSTEYSLSSNTITWAAGESGTKTITIDATSDTVIGDTETITLSLALPANSNSQPVIGAGTFALTITDSSPSGFIPFVESDGEWEVCISPYQTTTSTAFSNQLSATSGSVVTCIKQCPIDAVIDTSFTGWGWNAAGQHSCLFTTASEGTITRAPVYTPQREVFTLALSTDTFTVADSIWVCTRENRLNAEFSYTIDATANTWYQILSDGTYYYADSINGVIQPETLNGPEIWSVAGRFLSFGHIGEIYRNVFVFPSGQTFQIHPDTDHRLNCQRLSTTAVSQNTQ